MFNYSALEIIAIILLSIIGLKIIVKKCKLLWTCYLGHALGFGVKWRPGESVWAVITGATDGIGLEYAKQLAAKGYSIVLISRSEDKLNNVKKQIQTQSPNCKQIKTVAVDFNGTDIYETIANELNSLDIDVLVNNVGVANKNGSEYFLTITSEQNDAFFNVNMKSFTKMTEIVLPKMVEKRRGIIINISSLVSCLPWPLFSAYAASKAYMTFLSDALSVEYESKGVIIQTVMPGGVETNMTKVFEEGEMPFMVKADQFVKQALDSVGIEWRTFGHRKHKFIGFLIEDIIQPIFGFRNTMKITFATAKKMIKT